MSPNPVLDRDAFVADQYARLVAYDNLPPAVAWRLAEQRADDAHPWLVAAPGQVWELRPDRRRAPGSPELLLITLRRPAAGAYGADIHAIDLTAPAAAVVELEPGDLTDYRITTLPADHHRRA